MKGTHEELKEKGIKATEEEAKAFLDGWAKDEGYDNWEHLVTYLSSNMRLDELIQHTVDIVQVLDANSSW